ncbi:MAG: hypothetical protein HFI17_18625 [Lachnospiraceae bacterium]|nr:hypothetical protein [Lachnospiraceae bacterium]
MTGEKYRYAMELYDWKKEGDDKVLRPVMKYLWKQDAGQGRKSCCRNKIKTVMDRIWEGIV